jgi:hypothetical protein
MFSIIAVVLLIYLTFTTVQALINHGWPFGTLEWVMLVMCLLYIPMAVFMAVRTFKDHSANKTKREEEAQRLERELAERRRRIYLEDDGGLSDGGEENDGGLSDDGEENYSGLSGDGEENDSGLSAYDD